MLLERFSLENLSEFLKYLAAKGKYAGERLPSLTGLSQELGVSVASLREQLEVARALGLVEVRPRTGIRPLPYSFKPAVRQSLAFGISIDPELVHTYSDLRNHLEAAYFDQAVALLTADDQQALRALVASAFSKLRGQPAQIPHGEHRELHMLIYSRLNNVFVNGLLEAYWEMYEAVGLNVYTDLRYLERVWQYHQRMVDAICAGDIAAGRAALLEHINLLDQRSKPLPRQQFE